MQCGPREWDNVAGKKDRGAARKPEGREGPAGGLSPQALLLGRGCECRAPTSVYGQAQAFPARLFLSSLRGRWLPNWVAPLGSGIEHLSNEVVLYRRSNKSATSSPTFSPRNSTSSANCRIISCVSGNGVMRSPPRYSILIENRGHCFGVFTLGSENDLPLPIGMPL